MSDDIFKLLEDLEEHIQGCRHVPMTDKVLVNEEVLFGYLDRIRSLLPEELHRAKLMVKDREQLMEDARGDAERILTEANRRVMEMAEESEIARRAEVAAEEIVAQSRRVALEIKNSATLYADDILRSLEANLNQNLETIRNGREELGQIKKDRPMAVSG
jgi:vacuolar-type H+-ATPase subunit H